MDASGTLDPEQTAADLAPTGFTHADDRLLATFTTADFASAVRLLDAVAVVADESNHHPDVHLGWGRVTFELSSHDAGGVTGRDVELARRIRALADQQGARPN
ncbi:4a-hydroxytetrahydrobiopterin dehydratase [Agromyces salentinus]|uniref:Putative pterin-4-alpha-carbinolamine dehydratase n=1 Tax=Agromyces salentinus TaxID=269421 RepID=A0ABN2N0I5_9MICO|nr:4a-hydroxytetrahydrobiopterin dehydratase [Agromyces salentinus]